MLKRVQRALAATVLVAGVAASFNGCAIIGTLDFDIKFKPTGFATGVDCSAANVISIQFRFLDQALDGLLRTEVARPCVANERYKVSIDLGPYNIQVRGLNGSQTICYESTIPYTVVGGQTEMLTLVSEQHPNGATGGCVYPGAPPP